MRAWAYLSRVAEAPCGELADLVRATGPVEAAERIRRGEVEPGLSKRTEARRDSDCAAADLELLHRRGGRLLTPDDDEWPHLAFSAFAGTPVRQKPQGYAPLALWVVGPLRLDEVAERAAAIVGTRMPTAYGEHVASDLSAGLAEHDVAVVSGGAYGVDGAAHRAALAAEGHTVAVLAGEWMFTTRPAIPRCSTGSPPTACWSVSIRPACARLATGSSPAIDWSRRWPAPRWSSRRAFAAVRRAPRHGRGHSAGWCVRCPAP